MYATTLHVIPVQTIFGPGYVAEQHTDCSNLPNDRGAGYTDFVKVLTSLLWDCSGAVRLPPSTKAQVVGMRSQKASKGEFAAWRGHAAVDLLLISSAAVLTTGLTWWLIISSHNFGWLWRS